MNPKILAQKEQAVKDLQVKAEASDTIIVVEYRGLTVTETQELRTALKEVDATIGVYKNSVVRRALGNLGHSDYSETLVGPNAVIFGSNPTGTPKAIFKFARDHEALVVKSGIIDGRTMDAKELKTLSRLPGKDGLVSMLLSVLQAPIRQLACALDGVAKTKAN